MLPACTLTIYKTCYSLASPQTSFGVRLSRIRNGCVTNEPSKDVCGEASYSLDHHIHINQLILSLRFTPWIVLYPPVLSSAEAPAGFPNKNSNNRKIESARGTMGRGKRRERSFPFPSCPARSLFLSPQPPYYTKRPLRKREPSLYPQVQ